MFTTDGEFEDEVRRIARLLWPSAEFGGAAIVESRERDGIFEGDEFVHCIECTVSRQKDKATDDGAKLDRLMRKLGPKNPTKFIKGWFITLNEPTADQRTVIQKYKGRIVACSYDQFSARLVDARTYLTLRDKYPFGSVRDPASGAASFDLKYVPLDIVAEAGDFNDVETIIRQILSGEKVVLTGDYGAGKSCTAREVFKSLGRQFWEGKTFRFPVLLNLRDHHGQSDPVEALERHARKVGFDSPPSIVRAWRAGYCIPMLDGFDEIASAGWAGLTKRLRDLRYRSMELLRQFIRETPPECGMLITGREHFFDSERELREALAVASRPSRLHRLRLMEFNADQVAHFLSDLGWNDNIPEWLPARPLLLAYLVGKKLLAPGQIAQENSSPAAGWNELLKRIAEREAEIEAGIDPSTVRRLIERIATAARSSPDGLGPLSPDTIIACFKTVCGYSPDDRGAVLLQRLPGLGAASAEDGSRVFIDKDYAEAARGGDIFSFILDPRGTQLDCETWQTSLRLLGAEIVAYRCEISGQNAGKINAALQVADEHQRACVLATDILLALTRLGWCYTGSGLYLKETMIDELVIDDATCNLAAIEFQDGVVGCLELGTDISREMLPTFRRCHFARMEGRTGERDLPSDRFIECTFDEFENAAQTTRAILALALPLASRVLLTLLKKLFAQAGSGRQESALFRGLDHREREVVPAILDLLRRRDFVVKSRQGTVTVWLPARTGSVRKRAMTMLAAPSASRDPVLEESKQLS
jgi:hypothetical protein